MPEPESTTLVTRPDSNALSQFETMGDLRCVVTVVLGSATITVRDCLELRHSSVLRLRETAGEDLFLQANGVDVGRGEIVVLEGRTAVRLNEVCVGATAT